MCMQMYVFFCVGVQKGFLSSVELMFVLLCMFFLIWCFEIAAELNYIMIHTIMIKLVCVVITILFVFRAMADSTVMILIRIFSDVCQHMKNAGYITYKLISVQCS